MSRETVSVESAMHFASEILPHVADCHADRCMVVLSKEVTRLRADNAALRSELAELERKFKQSPMWDTLAIIQTRNNWKERALNAEKDNAALRATLERARSMATEPLDQWSHAVLCSILRTIHSEAQAALAKEQK